MQQKLVIMLLVMSHCLLRWTQIAFCNNITSVIKLFRLWLLVFFCVINVKSLYEMFFTMMMTSSTVWVCWFRNNLCNRRFTNNEKRWAKNAIFLSVLITFFPCDTYRVTWVQMQFIQESEDLSLAVKVFPVRLEKTHCLLGVWRNAWHVVFLYFKASLWKNCSEIDVTKLQYKIGWRAVFLL